MPVYAGENEMSANIAVDIDIAEAKKDLERVIKNIGLGRFVNVDLVDKWLAASGNTKHSVQFVLSMLTGLLYPDGTDDEASISELCSTVAQLYNAHRVVTLKAEGKKTDFSGNVEVLDYQLPPTDWVTDFEEAMFMLHKSQFDEAAERFDNMFDELLRSNTTVSDVYRIFYNAGTAYLFSGRPDLGRYCMTWALDLNPNYPFCRRKLKELDTERVQNLITMGVLQKRLKDFEAWKQDHNLDKVLSWSTKKCMTELKKAGVQFELSEFLDAARKVNLSSDIARNLFEPRAEETRRYDDIHWMAALSIWMKECPEEPAMDVLDEFIDEADNLLDELDYKVGSSKAISKYDVAFSKIEKILLTEKKGFHKDWMKSLEYLTRGKFVLLDFLCSIVADPVFTDRTLNLAEYLKNIFSDPRWSVVKIVCKIEENDLTWKEDYALLSEKLPYDYLSHIMVSKGLARIGDIDQSHQVLLAAVSVVDKRRKDKKFDMDDGILTIYDDYQFVLRYLTDFYEKHDITNPNTALISNRKRMLEKEEKKLKYSKRLEKFDSTAKDIISKIMIKEIEESPAHLYYQHLKNLNINFKTASDVKTVEGNITVVPEPGTSIQKKSKVGRNDPCPCGSGKKYKKCCLENE